MVQQVSKEGLNQGMERKGAEVFTGSPKGLLRCWQTQIQDSLPLGPPPPAGLRCILGLRHTRYFAGLPTIRSFTVIVWRTLYSMPLLQSMCKCYLHRLAAAEQDARNPAAIHIVAVPAALSQECCQY